MKFSLKWLKTWINIKVSDKDLLHKLTFAGLEVEGTDGDMVELNITPNRGDCLSIKGIATEAALICNGEFKPIEINPCKATINDELPIKLQSEHCPRYVGRVIKGINPNANTPAWIKERLTISGIKTISPAVDIANYVMLELGQPMHAFDLNTLDSEIIVRNSNFEELDLLDETTAKLDKDTLVISDKNKVLAIAGIMGGADSGVSGKTTNIFLESAYFNPIKIRNKVKKYNLHSDSSYRFERGVDFELQTQAIERATELLLDIVGGDAGPVTHAVLDNSLPKLKAITFQTARVKQLLGIELDESRILDIFKNLNLTVNKDGDKYKVIPPSSRSDLSLEDDLVEEVARVYGYDNIPSTPLKGTLSFIPQPETKVNVASIKQLMAHENYNEVINYSFLNPEVAEMVASSDELIKLKNPISSDLATMRPYLFLGLLKSLQFNLSRKVNNARFFEVGTTFKQKTTLEQEMQLAGLCAGKLQCESWGNSKADVDFYTIKGEFVSILHKLGVKGIEFQAMKSSSFMHTGKSAVILKDNKEVGFIGAPHPGLLEKLDIQGPVFIFEVSVKALQLESAPKFTPISKYPAVRRDLALLVPEQVSAMEITNIIKQTKVQHLQGVNIFDVYQGKNVTKGHKSIAVSVTFQSIDATLTDDVVNTNVEDILRSLNKELNVTLRV